MNQFHFAMRASAIVSMLCVTALSARPSGKLKASLQSTVDPQALVGDLVQWTASTEDENSSSMRFRFTVMQEDGSGHYESIRDFGPNPDFYWLPAEREGQFLVEMTATNTQTGDTVFVIDHLEVLPRVRGPQSLITSMDRSNLFLFSAAACAQGSRMKISFQPTTAASLPQQATGYKECNGATTMNFYLAGLLPNTEYAANTVVEDSAAVAVPGPAITFLSSEAVDVPEHRTVTRSPLPNSTQPLLLASNGYATDLNGTMLWSGAAPVTLITRPESGGYFWGVVEDPGADISRQGIRKFDLAGIVVRETNAEQINHQLRALGKRTISSFHHEVGPLADGRIVALAAVEQIVTDKQGAGDVNVIGDMILVLDRNLAVLWAWDTFDWLDINRAAVLGETCEAYQGGCPPFYLTSVANDWTHGNSVQPTPDGNLIYSSRHQDWLIKIAYEGGEGDGHVMWKLGRNGDFAMDSKDPWPWFSHQHDGNFDSGNPAELLVFDNGNTRWSETGEAESRGQVIELDEVNHVARLKLNADLGVLAAAVGSAQRLTNGNYHFEAGYVIQPNSSLAAYAIEVDRAGRKLYEMEARGLVYRSFRMTDLYTAPH